MSEKLKFNISETGEEVEFYIVDETRINNRNYLLVTESDDESEEETDAYILKDVSDASDTEAVYEIVEDDDELDYVSRIFSEMLDDVDITK